MRIALVVLLVALLAMPTFAADLDLKAEKVEVNGLIGTLGAAGGVFWPVLHVPKYDIRLGPMAAIGEETAVAGGGIKIPVSVNAPVLNNINFGWIGYGYNWVEKDWGLEGGVGVVVKIQ